MGNAWDRDRIKGNLDQLAQINTNGRTTDKLALSFFKGTMWVQQDGLGTKIARSMGPLGDSIKNKGLKKGLVELFAKAKNVSQSGDMIPGGLVTVGDIRQALAGLNRLLQTYAADRDRSQILQGIIDDIREVLNAGQVNVEREEFYHSFLDEYSDHQIFGVKQAELLPMSEKGVCKAMCLDWIRRKIVEKIDSLAITDSNAHQHSFGSSLRGNEHLSGVDDPRMRQTALETWLPMQRELEALNMRGDNSARFNHMKKTVGGFEMLHHAFLVTQHGFRSERKTHRPMTNAEDDLEAIIKLCLNAHATYGDDAGFVLGVQRAFRRGGARGHAIGFHFSAAAEVCRIHILDPGIAEWEFFAPTERVKLHEFWASLLELYAIGGDPFIKWDLDCYYLEG